MRMMICCYDSITGREIEAQKDHHVSSCIMHSFSPRFLREKQGCALYMGNSNSVCI